MRYDIAIVGGGLAGACAALWLSTTRSVLLIEAAQPASGASGIAAGLVNPIKGLRATPMWRFEEALAALEATLSEAGASDLFRRTGVLRPARDSQQAEVFERAAFRYSDHGIWLRPEDAQTRYPHVRADFGGLFVRSGGVVDIPAMIASMLKEAGSNGAEIRTKTAVVGWNSRRGRAEVETTGGSIEADILLLCLGAGYATFPELNNLPLHKVKGQSIRLSSPNQFPKDHPAVSSGLYIVPEGTVTGAGAGSVLVGATFEHLFSDLATDPALSLKLKEEAVALMPSLAESGMIDAQAGIRVTVPKVRLPLLGPLPGSKHIWIFTALGAKGLMSAPLLARDLPVFLANPETLPMEVRPPR